jgi:hypothetical protein
MVNWLTDKRHQRHHRESFLLVSAENRGPVEDGSAPRRLRALKAARIFAVSPRAAFQSPPIENKDRHQRGIWSAFIGLILLVAGGGIAYFGLYLPFVTGRSHDMKASLAAPMMIGYGLALLLLGQGFGQTMYHRKDGVYIPTLVGAATLVVRLVLGVGLDWWLKDPLYGRRY